MRLRIVRTKLHNSGEIFLRLRKLSALREKRSKLFVRFDIGGIQTRRCEITRHGSFHVAFLLIFSRRAFFLFEKTWLQLQCNFEFTSRLTRLARVRQHIGEVEMCFDIVGAKPDYLLEWWQRVLEISF